jgi:glycogen(starch) synthase
MHILHIVQLYYPVASGAGRYFAEIGERLAAEGHAVTVLSTDAHDLEFFWNAARRRVETPAETHNGSSASRCGASPARRSPTRSCAG